jgi:hypothetical protein
MLKRISFYTLEMFRKIFQPREILVSLCKRDVVYRIPLWEKIVPDPIVVKVDKGYLEIKFGVENPPAETLGGVVLENEKQKLYPPPSG